ncbi:MAG: Hsp33 family molecular chaperone HslO [Eubacterium sp.]|nr:Hsp33 family molecular chaperone HslO [Eubacterium sp.]
MDYIVRATAAGGQIRAFAATTKDMAEKARSTHDTSPVVTAALGRLMTGSAMMGVMMKGENDLLTVKVSGDGPAGALTVTADARGNVKGTVDVPQAMVPARADHKLDVGGVVGRGFMQVIKDLGLKEPYVSQVALQTGEIGDDFTYYFASSEQVPSAVGLGVLMNKENTVRRSGGFIVQLMPFASEETISALEENIKNIASVTVLLEEGLSPEQLLDEVLKGFDIEINDTVQTQFLCDCNRERFYKGICALPKSDIKEMVDDGEPIEVKCHFCGKKYEFSVDDLKGML